MEKAAFDSREPEEQPLARMSDSLRFMASNRPVHSTSSTLLRSLTMSVAIAGAALSAGCDSSTPMTTPDAGGVMDAASPLEMSSLFEPCEEDWQCPGEGAVCRLPADGYPRGFCTVPCSDRTPCDAFGRYHHCVARAGETQAYCEVQCRNGEDCGRAGYTCTGYDTLPTPGGICIGSCTDDSQCGDGETCDTYTNQCTATPAAGADTGEPCAGNEACRSVLCNPAANGWPGGYCLGLCILPVGYNSTSLFEGDTLPQADCPADAICFLYDEHNSPGDQGVCVRGCTGDDDCRSGYTCRRSFQVGSGSTRTFENGYCTPAM